MTGPCLLATGFVSDSAGEGTSFPSAGGNSADLRVQAIYWRCLTVFFASARITNPGLRLALFSNVPAPQVDGIDIGAVLDRLGVEQRRLPLVSRLSPGKTAAWGNVLYFLDILDSLDAQPGNLRLALTDSDVVVTGPIDEMFGLLDNHEFAGYIVDSAPDEPINGMTPLEMARAASEIDGLERDGPVPHYGGELLATTPMAWSKARTLFHDLFARADAGDGDAGRARTEEHLYSIAFATLGGGVADANHLMKRIWTSPRYTTSRPGDERLPMWHMPAEKRYGLADLFRDLARRGFPLDMTAEEFRYLAASRCGLPSKSAGKIVRDGIRQVASKLGLRT